MLLKSVDESTFDMFISTIIAFIDGLLETKADIKNISVVLIKEARQFEKTIVHGQKLLDELII
jgi:alanyl-tRNA synthetase